MIILQPGCYMLFLFTVHEAATVISKKKIISGASLWHERNSLGKIASKRSCFSPQSGDCYRLAWTLSPKFTHLWLGQSYNKLECWTFPYSCRPQIASSVKLCDVNYVHCFIFNFLFWILCDVFLFVAWLLEVLFETLIKSFEPNCWFAKWCTIFSAVFCLRNFRW